VGDEDGLDGLDDDDSFLALLPVQTPLLGFDHHVPLVGDPQPVALDLLHRVGVIVRGHDLLDLGGGNLEGGAVSMVSCPCPTSFICPNALGAFSSLPSMNGVVCVACEGTAVKFDRERTVKPGELAQTLSPLTLKMAALSMLPVPMRLCRSRGQR